MITLSMILTGIALKHEKVGPTFSSLNPWPFLLFIATDDREKFHCLNVVSNKKLGQFKVAISDKEQLAH